MKRADRKIENRQRILDAAARVFEREGLVRASMRKIAKEAGCTTGAIYPHFDGKEALYVALLHESLDRLHETVVAASAQTDNPLSRLCTAVSAFYDYYMSNQFEANLGMYIYGMGQVKSMGRELDQLLNQKLLKTLDIFSASLQVLRPPDVSGDAVTAWVVAERDLIFTMLIGILGMRQSGRAKSIDTTPAAIFANYLTHLRDRYGAMCQPTS